MRRSSLVAGLLAAIVVAPLALGSGVAAAPGPRAPAPPAAGPPPGFGLVSYPTGQAPYNLTNYFWLPDGGLVTGGWDGTITYVAPGGVPATIGQVPDVRAIGNHGMLGFAAAKDYRTTGTVYLSYAKGVPEYDVPGVGMVEKWVASPPAAPTSFTYVSTLIDGATTSPPLVEKEWTHGLDAVEVAPDGTLFVGVGDNSRNNGDPATLRAQDLDQPYGKLLHITSTGGGVATNPFYQPDAPSSWRSRVYAYGFRNPYRFALDARNGLVQVGDVGWRRVEEVDTIHRGDNAGWPCYEGNRMPSFITTDPTCQAMYASGTARMPIVTYRHNGAPAAVVGGVFYAGDSYPRTYRGAFFYGDYNTEKVWTLRTDRHGALVRGPEHPPFMAGAFAPVEFRAGPNGDITFADLNSGHVVRIMTRIDMKFAALPHPWLLLGHPAGAERDIVGGQVRTYARGRIYWSGATGAHEIHGVILAAYRARPRQRACLGFPATDVTRIPGGVRSRFAHGTITHWRAAGRTSISCAGAGR